MDDLNFVALECADEFWTEVEALAALHQVTCDYILEEFYIDQ